MIYIAFLIFIFLILALAFYQWQYYMVFSPLYYREERLSKECQILSIMTDDGVELEGVVYEPKNHINTLLVFVGRSHDAVGLIDRLARSYLNTKIITFNYRSYGKSGGIINEKNILNDALQIAKLVQKNYGDFYILGFSLGSSVASYVASKHKTKGLFLVGVFDSIASLVKSKLGISISKVLRYNFNTDLYVKDILTDTYLFVSKDDETTYIKNSRILKYHVKNLVYYVEFDDLKHKEILWDERVRQKIREVIEI